MMKDKLISLIIFKKVCGKAQGAFVAAHIAGLRSERYKTVLSEFRAAALNAGTLLITKQLEYEVYKDMRAQANQLLSIKDYAALYYLRFFEKLLSINLDHARTAKLYRLFILIGMHNIKLSFLAVGRANNEYSAANYFLSTSLGGSFLAGIRELQNYRQPQYGIVDVISKRNIDFLVVLDSGLNDSIKRMLMVGDFFVLGLSDRKFSAYAYDVTITLDAVTPEIKQLFLEFTISGILLGMQKRAELLALSKLSLFSRTIL